MTLALSFSPLADLTADLLRRMADIISPPRPGVTERAAPSKPRLTLVPPQPPPPARDPAKERAMLSAEFKNRLPPHLRRDIGIDC